MSAATNVWFHTATAILQCVPMFGDMPPCRRRRRSSRRRASKALNIRVVLDELAGTDDDIVGNVLGRSNRNICRFCYGKVSLAAYC